MHVGVRGQPEEAGHWPLVLRALQILINHFMEWPRPVCLFLVPAMMRTFMIRSLGLAWCGPSRQAPMPPQGEGNARLAPVQDSLPLPFPACYRYGHSVYSNGDEFIDTVAVDTGEARGSWPR